ncbi:lytic transglycosylase domain-containing protein [Cereibacter sphaeroides]|nr:lytic transglycosylase domain-containing protein [Cereibacter sphaeroides]
MSGYRRPKEADPAGLPRTKSSSLHSHAPALRSFLGSTGTWSVSVVLTSAIFGALCATAGQAEPLNPVAFQAVAENCAPSVAPSIIEKLVAAESGFELYAIGVNGKDRKSFGPRSAREAAELARALIAEGKSIDMGLGQINSANLNWLELTPETVFDPCRNLAAAEIVLRDGYDRARSAGASKDEALQQALSHYNTGSLTRGFANGYVGRVLGGAVHVSSSGATQPVMVSEEPETTWDVFGHDGTSSAHVFRQ